MKDLAENAANNVGYLEGFTGRQFNCVNIKDPGTVTVE